MTVNYNLCVSTSSPLSLFKLLLRWRGSIWKSVWVEFLGYLVVFNLISLVYRELLNSDQQRNFEHLIVWVKEGLKSLPLEFMLGFFVQVVVTRWGVLFSNIGLIDTLALTISGYLTGNSDQERLWRRNVVRYCVLSQVLVFRDISMQVRNRFPTIDTVVAAGIMLPHEREKFEELQYGYGKPWMPFQWAICSLRKARKCGAINSDYLLEKCCEQVRNFRNNMATLTNYDWVPIPIMYPQIVFLAVYVHFTLALVGSQPIKGQEKVWFGIYLPVMSGLKFLFYMGWLKVAEALLNPLGEDDDDFETNFLIDRNLAVGFAIVDECYDDSPVEQADNFWNDGVIPLYSELAAERAINPLEGSAAQVELPENVQTINMVPRADETEATDGVKHTRTVSIRRASRTSTVGKNSVRKRKNGEKPPSTTCYHNNVSTIDEIEMDEISLRSHGKEAKLTSVSRY